MTKKSASEQIAEWPEPEVCVLDEAKAKRLGARTMLMPSPLQVQEAILQIPTGQAKTVKQFRTELAASAGADMACPVATKHCWRLVAEVAEEKGLPTPWWRLTLDGKPNSRLPGGIERHRQMAQTEGISLA